MRTEIRIFLAVILILAGLWLAIWTHAIANLPCEDRYWDASYGPYGGAYRLRTLPSPRVCALGAASVVLLASGGTCAYAAFRKRKDKP